MQNLMTQGLIHFCHEEDQELIEFLRDRKIKGRAFEVMTENDFPEFLRIQYRLLRRAIEVAIE